MPRATKVLSCAPSHEHLYECDPRRGERTAMPYRSELKRPDLKGQFPCTVCGKIFCHSSSLSRHRMQAHFKSFTCTQCNKEISSSETLRSHMFRAHSISRMFMCRCCNWAFPDKTSLHIHMQSMARSGHPGDVAVLARSSTETGPEGSPSQEMNCSSPGSRPESRNTASPEQNSSSSRHNNNNNNNSSKNSNFLQRSIFPAMANERADLLSTLSATNNDGANQWLSLWLANNPLPTNNPLSLTLSDISASLLSNGQTQLGSNSTERESSCTDADNTSENENENNGSSLYDEIRNDSPMETISEACGISGELSKSDRRNKRKSRRPMQLSSLPVKTSDPTPSTVLEFDETTFQPPCKVTVTSIENGKELSSQGAAEQPSPTVSDSHTSGSSTQGSGLVSPKKCFECQESSTHYENEIQQLRSQLSEELHKQEHCDKCDVAQERIDQIQKQVEAIMTAIGSQNNFPGEIRHLLDELSHIITV